MYISQLGAGQKGVSLLFGMEDIEISGRPLSDTFFQNINFVVNAITIIYRKLRQDSYDWKIQKNTMDYNNKRHFY